MAPAQYSLSDLVAVLLQSIAADSKDSNLHLHEKPSELHWAFYKLKTAWADQFPPLAQLHFVTAGPFPYSHDLNEVLDTLQSSDALSRINPHYESFAPATYDDTPDWLAEEKRRIAATPRKRAAFEQAVKQLHEALLKPA